MTLVNDDLKVGLVKKSIATEEGWVRLARAITTPASKDECIRLLKIIGGDAVVECEAIVTNPDTNESHQEMINVSLSDRLIQQLEEFIVKTTP